MKGEVCLCCCCRPVPSQWECLLGRHSLMLKTRQYCKFHMTEHTSNVSFRDMHGHYEASGHNYLVYREGRGAAGKWRNYLRWKMRKWPGVWRTAASCLRDLAHVSTPSAWQYPVLVHGEEGRGVQYRCSVTCVHAEHQSCATAVLCNSRHYVSNPAVMCCSLRFCIVQVWFTALLLA